MSVTTKEVLSLIKPPDRREVAPNKMAMISVWELPHGIEVHYITDRTVPKKREYPLWDYFEIIDTEHTFPGFGSMNLFPEQVYLILKLAGRARRVKRRKSK